MKFHITIARTKDAAHVAILFDAYRQFYNKPSDINSSYTYILQRLKNLESIIFLAWNDQSEAIGFCQLYPTFCSLALSKTYILHDLFVWPSFRKQEIGKRLICAATKHAKDSGIVRVDLLTAKTNIIAQSLYSSLGWKQDNEYYLYAFEVLNVSDPPYTPII